MIKVNKVKKIIALAMAVLVGVTRHIGTVRSNANEVSNELDNLVSEEQLPKIGAELGRFNENGIEYVITSYDEDDCQYSQIIDINDETRKDIIFTNNKKNLKIVEYKKVFTEEDNKMYTVVDRKSVDLEVLAMQIERNLKASQQSSRYEWDRRQEHPYKDDLWYRYGESSYGNKYLEIGRKASYRIAYYKLSKDEKENCNKYTKKIDSANLKMCDMIVVYGTGLISTILAALETGGFGAALGIIGTVRELRNDFEELKKNYNKAADLYNKIKKYGEKI